MATVVVVASSLTAWAAQPALAFDARSPDTRAVAGHAPATGVIDARSPDTRGLAGSAGPKVLLDFRSPDTRDGRFSALTGTSIMTSDLFSPNRFHSAEFGMGVGAAVGSMLLLAGLAAGGLLRQRRPGKSHPATT
jgi:hypothetical protein